MGDLIVAPPELRHSAYGERIIDMPYSYHVTDQASVRCFQNSNYCDIRLKVTLCVMIGIPSRCSG